MGFYIEEEGTMVGQALAGSVSFNTLREDGEESFLMPLKRWRATSSVQKIQMRGLVLRKVKVRYRRLRMLVSFLPCIYFDDCV